MRIRADVAPIGLLSEAQKVWVRTDNCATIGAIAAHIASLLFSGGSRSVPTLQLWLDDAVLPDDEASDILQEGDTISVKAAPNARDDREAHNPQQSRGEVVTLSGPARTTAVRGATYAKPAQLRGHFIGNALFASSSARRRLTRVDVDCDLEVPAGVVVAPVAALPFGLSLVSTGGLNLVSPPSSPAWKPPSPPTSPTYCMQAERGSEVDGEVGDGMDNTDAEAAVGVSQGHASPCGGDGASLKVKTHRKTRRGRRAGRKHKAGTNSSGTGAEAGKSTGVGMHVESESKAGSNGTHVFPLDRGFIHPTTPQFIPMPGTPQFIPMPGTIQGEEEGNTEEKQQVHLQGFSLSAMSTAADGYLQESPLVAFGRPPTARAREYEVYTSTMQDYGKGEGTATDPAADTAATVAGVGGGTAPPPKRPRLSSAMMGVSRAMQLLQAQS